MAHVVYAELSPMQAGPSPMRQTDSTVYATLAGLHHTHDTCDDCNALIDADGNALHQARLCASAIACRRTRTSPDFSTNDFEILLVHAPPPKGDEPPRARQLFAVPAIPVGPGERPELSAMRAVRECARINAFQSHLIAPHNVIRPGVHEFHLLHHVAAAPSDTPQNVDGMNAKYYQLRAVIEDRDFFQLHPPHREMIDELQGWLRQQFAMDTIDTIYTAAARTPSKVVTNPIFGSHLEPISDKPLLSYNNPWFESGELKPPAGTVGRRASTRDRFPHHRSMSMRVPGSGTGISRTEDSRPVSQEDTLPLNGGAADALPRNGSITAALASRGASLQPTSGGPSRASSVHTVYTSQDEPPSSTASSDSETEDEEDVDDVVLALRGLQARDKKAQADTASDDFSRQSSTHFDTGGFNPLADDLNADFSNPLAEL